MKIVGLNSGFEYVGTYDNFIELAWNRKYYEPGDFSLYMRAEDYDSTIKYMQVSDDNGQRPETAIIQKLEYEEKISGEYITLSGFFLEAWLNNYTTSINTYIGYAADSASNTQYMAMLSRFGVPVTQITGDAMTASAMAIEGFQPVGAALFSELQEIQSACRISYDSGYKIKFWKGTDVSDDVVFAKNLGNVSDIKYTHDESNHRTLCRGYASGSEATDGAAAVGAQCSDGNYYVINSSGSGEKIISANVTVDDIEVVPANAMAIYNAIPSQCNLELLNYLVENNVDITVLQNGVFYLKDYDLGNVVSVSIPKIDISYAARIIEVSEVWKENHQEISLEIGNQVRRKK